MKRLSIYFLTFLTIWMSTWLVTDIHDWSIADVEQAHPVFSVQSTQSVTNLVVTNHDNEAHCGVCSYDHGGHIGQTLAAVFYHAESILDSKSINSPPPPNYWDSRNIAPKFRPPIA